VHGSSEGGVLCMLVVLTVSPVLHAAECAHSRALCAAGAHSGKACLPRARPYSRDPLSKLSAHSNHGSEQQERIIIKAGTSHRTGRELPPWSEEQQRDAASDAFMSSDASASSGWQSVPAAPPLCTMDSVSSVLLPPAPTRALSSTQQAVQAAPGASLGEIPSEGGLSGEGSAAARLAGSILSSGSSSSSSSSSSGPLHLQMHDSAVSLLRQRAIRSAGSAVPAVRGLPAPAAAQLHGASAAQLLQLRAATLASTSDSIARSSIRSVNSSSGSSDAAISIASTLQAAPSAPHAQHAAVSASQSLLSMPSASLPRPAGIDQDALLRLLAEAYGQFMLCGGAAGLGGPAGSASDEQLEEWLRQLLELSRRERGSTVLALYKALRAQHAWLRLGDVYSALVALRERRGRAQGGA
jgi:hypothetical protein